VLLCCVTVMDVFSSTVLRHSVGYPDDEVPQSKLTEAVAITLAAHHNDIHIEGAGILDIARDLLANYKEKSMFHQNGLELDD